MTSFSFIKLEIPTAVAEPASGEGWIHEIEYDGRGTISKAPVRAKEGSGTSLGRPCPLITRARDDFAALLSTFALHISA